MRTPKLDRPVSISELAVMWHRPERTVRHWLVCAHRRCGYQLLYREGESQKWLTTVGRLRRLVPELVDAGPGGHDEVAELQAKVRVQELKIRALAAALRQHRDNPIAHQK